MSEKHTHGAEEVATLLDKIVEKAFKTGFEMAYMEIISGSKTPEQLTYAYIREALAEAAWLRVKSKL